MLNAALRCRVDSSIPLQAFYIVYAISCNFAVNKIFRDSFNAILGKQSELGLSLLCRALKSLVQHTL